MAFGFVSRTQRAEVRSVLLRSLRGSKLVLDRFTCENPAIKLKAVETTAEGEVALRVALRPEHVNNAATLATTIRVYAKDGSRISIPVVAKLLSDE